MAMDRSPKQIKGTLPFGEQPAWSDRMTTGFAVEVGIDAVRQEVVSHLDIIDGPPHLKPLRELSSLAKQHAAICGITLSTRGQYFALYLN